MKAEYSTETPECNTVTSLKTTIRTGGIPSTETSPSEGIVPFRTDLSLVYNISARTT
jgi:hypothetical protein